MQKEEEGREGKGKVEVKEGEQRNEKVKGK